MLRCEESLELSDEDSYLAEEGLIRFKSDPRWAELYQRVLGILRTREHVGDGA